MMKQSAAIKMIEMQVSAAKQKPFKISPEQEKILTCGFKKPTLVNACAGAGKTTTMILSMLNLALTKSIDPSRILAITFSRRARRDMQEKYAQLAQGLTNAKPMFRTFHSLFYGILRQTYHMDLKVTGAGFYSTRLMDKILHPIGALSVKENVARFTDVASSLINKGYSMTGLDVNLNSRYVQLAGAKNIDMLLEKCGYSGKDYIEDYKRVINAYRTMKTQDHSVDFDDMQTLLLRTIQKGPEQLAAARMALKNYQYCFLDEFQDINALQWELIIRLLPNIAKRQLVAIGDDDQAIYSFRGSDSSFILNFDKIMPDSQTFNLSTNYRTHENILNIAKPLILTNSLRLPKKLYANSDGGNVYYALRKSITRDPALIRFIRDIKHAPKSRRFAVLSRTNLNLSVIGDILAAHGVSPDMGDDFEILQNTKVYKILVQTMQAIFDNDFEEYCACSRWLGFSKYKNFLDEIDKLIEPRSLSDYLKRVRKDVPDVLLKKLAAKGAYRIKNVFDTERTVAALLRDIKYDPSDPELAQAVYQATLDITQDYFRFVISHMYVSYSENDYEQMSSYLQNRVEKAKNLKEFLAKEDIKKRTLEAIIKAKTANVRLMTMHGAKGLEFDETLIYESNGGTIFQPQLDLAETLPASLTEKDMKNRFNDFAQGKDPVLASQTLACMLACGIDEMVNAVKLSYGQRRTLKRYLKQAYANENFEEELADMSLPIDWTKITKRKHFMDTIYYDAHKLAKEAEEEKRLYYVAITRAKKTAIFDRADSMTAVDNLLDLSGGIQLLPDGKTEAEREADENEL